MNKANLYKLSNPHYGISTAKIHTFKVHIGPWEATRVITLDAYNVNDVLNKAHDYCRSDEWVHRISQNGQLIWENKDFK